MLAAQRDWSNMTLADLNPMTPAEFTTTLGAIYEHAAWVAAGAASARPFATVSDLHASMAEIVDAAPHEKQFALVAGHPDLGGKLARAGQLEAASAVEQAGLGLDRLSNEEFEAFDSMNAAYRTKFGFPFVIAVKRHTRASVLEAFKNRLQNDAETELTAALAEVHMIARFRLDALFSPVA
jgi:2-oxo-4-hydroxy-4-carboxy-5-ureidoimidazoline decarboxylase